MLNILPKHTKWPEPNKPQEKQPVVKLPRKPLPRRLQERLRPQEVVYRSKEDGDLVQLLSEKSRDTKRALHCCWGSCHSKDLWGKLLMNSILNSDSKPPRWSLFRKHLKPTLLDSLKTPIYAASMLREWPSCQKTFNLQEEFVEKSSDEALFYIVLFKFCIIFTMCILFSKIKKSLLSQNQNFTIFLNFTIFDIINFKNI